MAQGLNSFCSVIPLCKLLASRVQIREGNQEGHTPTFNCLFGTHSPTDELSVTQHQTTPRMLEIQFSFVKGRPCSEYIACLSFSFRPQVSQYFHSFSSSLSHCICRIIDECEMSGGTLQWNLETNRHIDLKPVDLNYFEL